MPDIHDPTVAQLVHDALSPLDDWQSDVQSRAYGAPPGGSAGQSWIVASPASGLWDNHVDNIARLNADGTYTFLLPREGLTTRVVDEGNVVVSYSGSAWELDSSGGGGGGTLPDAVAFTNATLVAGFLVITHNLNKKLVHVDIEDNNGAALPYVSTAHTSDNVETVDLTGYGTLTGTWYRRVY